MAGPCRLEEREQRRQQAFRDMLSEKERQRTSQEEEERRGRRRLLEPLHISRFAALVVDIDYFSFPGLRVGMDVKDSLVCCVGDASCVMFPSVVARPRMLCIMAGMDQKDSTHSALVVDSSSGICRAEFFLYSAGPDALHHWPVWTRRTVPRQLVKVICIPVVAQLLLSYGPDCSADRVSTVAPGQGGRCLLLCRCPGRQNPCRGAEAVSHGLPDHGHSPVAGGDGD